MIVPVDFARDQLAEIVANALHRPCLDREQSFHVMTTLHDIIAHRQTAIAIVDALAPVLADRDNRKLREGRNQAAEAIHADPSSRTFDGHLSVMGAHLVRVARGGSTDEEREGKPSGATVGQGGGWLERPTDEERNDEQ